MLLTFSQQSDALSTKLARHWLGIDTSLNQSECRFLVILFMISTLVLVYLEMMEDSLVCVTYPRDEQRQGREEMICWQFIGQI